MASYHKMAGDVYGKSAAILAVLTAVKTMDREFVKLLSNGTAVMWVHQMKASLYNGTYCAIPVLI
jgi:hypothetical protein